MSRINQRALLESRTLNTAEDGEISSEDPYFEHEARSSVVNFYGYFIKLLQF